MVARRLPRDRPAPYPARPRRSPSLSAALKRDRRCGIPSTPGWIQEDAARSIRTPLPKIDFNCKRRKISGSRLSHLEKDKAPAKTFKITVVVE